MFYLMQKLNQPTAGKPRHEIEVHPEASSAPQGFSPQDLNDEIDLSAGEGMPGSPATKRPIAQMSHSLKALRYLAQESQASGSEQWSALCNQLTKFDEACNRAYCLRARAAAWELSLTRLLHSEMATKCSLTKAPPKNVDLLIAFHRSLANQKIKPAQWSYLPLFPFLQVEITPALSSRSGACDFVGLLAEAGAEMWPPFPSSDILPDVRQEFKDLVRDQIDVGHRLLKGSEFPTYEKLVSHLMLEGLDEESVMRRITEAEEEEQLEHLREFRSALTRYLFILRFISRTFSGALFWHVLAPLVMEEYGGGCQLVPLSSETPPLQVYAAPLEQAGKPLFDRSIYASTNLTFAVRDPSDPREKIHSTFSGRLSILCEKLSKLGDDEEVHKLADTLGMPAQLRLNPRTQHSLEDLVNMFWPLSDQNDALTNESAVFTSLAKALRISLHTRAT